VSPIGAAELLARAALDFATTLRHDRGVPVNVSDSPRAGTLAARRALERGAGHGAYLDAMPRRHPRAFKWLNVVALWRSRNDRVARLLGDPTNDLRRRWMAWLRAQERLSGDPVVDSFADRERVSFVVMGDTGEGDVSQWVCVPPLRAIEHECDFAVICSDVVYPTGDVNQYVEKLYAPYAAWDKPIFALPGNHDWYDELEGFMYHLCGVDRPPDDFAVDGHEIRRPPLWRAPRPRTERAEAARRERPAGRVDQPGPYFVVDTGPIALVCIDTGIRGDLDRDQGAWLARVSKEVRKPKVLLTGKPLIVDGGYQPGVIESYDRTVDDIVRDPAHGYVAAIGGDIHNYQRYPVEVGDRCLEYIVAGGGGAFMHATHRIGRVDLGNVAEERFRCFPLRGDSLCLYAATLVPALRRLVLLASLLPFVLIAAALGAGWLLDRAFGGDAWPWVAAAVLFGGPFAASVLLWRQVDASGATEVLGLAGVKLTPQQASTWMSDRIGSAPTVAPPADVGREQEALMEFVAPRLHRTSGIFSQYFSEIFDIDSPPMYKHFLRLDADEHRLRISCCAAIGVEASDQRPLVEEWVEIELDAVRAALEGRALA
jgi:hypothetical protein